MSLKKFIINQAAYNLWVNQQYSNWLSQKPESLLSKELISSMPTIEKTLMHIWETQEYWVAIVCGTEYHAQTESPGVAAILQGLTESSERLLQFVESASEAALEESVTVSSQWFQSIEPRYNYILHLFGHGLYHRGQVVTMGRNVGITDAPMTDYNFYNVAMQN